MRAVCPHSPNLRGFHKLLPTYYESDIRGMPREQRKQGTAAASLDEINPKRYSSYVSREISGGDREYAGPHAQDPGSPGRQAIPGAPDAGEGARETPQRVSASGSCGAASERGPQGCAAEGL